jgi:hypothetical protein
MRVSFDNLPLDPNRFTPHRESLTATVTRTFAIAIVLAFMGNLIHFRHLPKTSGEWHRWLTLVVFVAWFSFGGHWVELAYLNGIRPKIAHWSDISLSFVRLTVWLIGGTILLLGAIMSRDLILNSEFPGYSNIFPAVLYGGPVFCAIELVVHVLLFHRGKPSFFNFRG